MSEAEIFAKIRSCFSKAFAGSTTFPFRILQSAGSGARSLIIPSLCDNYEWSAKKCNGEFEVYYKLHHDDMQYTMY